MKSEPFLTVLYFIVIGFIVIIVIYKLPQRWFNIGVSVNEKKVLNCNKNSYQAQSKLWIKTNLQPYS